MAFTALLPVRDEGDIISQTIHHALNWADAIYVFDSGSVDDTWDIVNEIAAKDKRVKPLRRQPVYYSETKLRGYLFDYAREFMRHGDWFVRLDADEFHHIPPPEFVKTHLRPRETIVYHQYYNFCLRQSEVDAWMRREETLADRARPIEDRRQHFTVGPYTEPRLCQYRSTMRWPETVSFPFNAGFVATERLPIRHYPHRDPVQLNRRARLRAIMMSDPLNRSQWQNVAYHYWEQDDWRAFITPDDKEGLRKWLPGQPLPRVDFESHLRPAHVRFVQRIVHGPLPILSVLDRTRASFTGESVLQPIPDVIQERLATVLQALDPADGGVTK